MCLRHLLAFSISLTKIILSESVPNGNQRLKGKIFAEIRDSFFIFFAEMSNSTPPHPHPHPILPFKPHHPSHPITPPHPTPSAPTPSASIRSPAWSPSVAFSFLHAGLDGERAGGMSQAGQTEARSDQDRKSGNGAARKQLIGQRTLCWRLGKRRREITVCPECT